MALLIEFQRWLEPKLGVGGELSSMPDWAGKLAGLVARVAGMFHVCIEGGARIGTDTMSNAIAFGEWALGHARRSFGLMGGDALEQDAAALLATIVAKGQSTISRRTLHQAVKGAERFKTIDRLEEPLELLIETGHIRPWNAPKAASGKGRRPGSACEVRPELISG